MGGSDKVRSDDGSDEDQEDEQVQSEAEETIHERNFKRRHQSPNHHHRHRTISSRSLSLRAIKSVESVGSIITRDALQHGSSGRPEEVQVLYRSANGPKPGETSFSDRHLKEEQAKQVAPNKRQSPISLMSINPAYEPQNKPLNLEYPSTVENLRISNTGFSWEVKIPYQVSMTTALYGAHMHRYRLDQFHCHWGSSEQHGSEHTVDGMYYSAELHFVHYNMERYHTMSKAARHPDGLVVLSVFLDAQQNHHHHAELEKIVANLKLIPLKGDHAIIKQAVRIDNLLPTNKSYWSYQGSLTTPPYLESVTWFVLKQPIKCSASQLERFRALKSNLRADDDEQVFITSNYRKTQPLNGRTVVTYDEPNGGPIKSPAAASQAGAHHSAHSPGRQSSGGSGSGSGSGRQH